LFYTIREYTGLRRERSLGTPDVLGKRLAKFRYDSFNIGFVLRGDGFGAKVEDSGLSVKWHGDLIFT